jgi:hypothetical protein
MKIRFNTMKKKEPVTNDFIRIEPSPIKHLIILTPYNRDKIYAYGYMREESRLFIQMLDGKLPEPLLCVFDNIPNKVAFEFEETNDKYDYLIKNIYPSYLTFNLPVLDIW